MNIRNFSPLDSPNSGRYIKPDPEGMFGKGLYLGGRDTITEHQPDISSIEYSHYREGGAYFDIISPDYEGTKYGEFFNAPFDLAIKAMSYPFEHMQEDAFESAEKAEERKNKKKGLKDEMKMQGFLAGTFLAFAGVSNVSSFANEIMWFISQTILQVLAAVEAVSSIKPSEIDKYYSMYSKDFAKAVLNSPEKMNEIQKSQTLEKSIQNLQSRTTFNPTSEYLIQKDRHEFFDKFSIKGTGKTNIEMDKISTSLFNLKKNNSSEINSSYDKRKEVNHGEGFVSNAEAISILKTLGTENTNLLSDGLNYVEHRFPKSIISQLRPYITLLEGAKTTQDLNKAIDSLNSKTIQNESGISYPVAQALVGFAYYGGEDVFKKESTKNFYHNLTTEASKDPHYTKLLSANNLLETKVVYSPCAMSDAKKPYEKREGQAITSEAEKPLVYANNVTTAIHEMGHVVDNLSRAKSYLSSKEELEARNSKIQEVKQYLDSEIAQYVKNALGIKINNFDYKQYFNFAEKDDLSEKNAILEETIFQNLSIPYESKTTQEYKEDLTLEQREKGEYCKNEIKKYTEESSKIQEQITTKNENNAREISKLQKQIEIIKTDNKDNKDLRTKDIEQQIKDLNDLHSNAIKPLQTNLDNLTTELNKAKDTLSKTDRNIQNIEKYLEVPDGSIIKEPSLNFFTKQYYYLQKKLDGSDKDSEKAETAKKMNETLTKIQMESKKINDHVIANKLENEWKEYNKTTAQIIGLNVVKKLMEDKDMIIRTETGGAKNGFANDQDGQFFRFVSLLRSGFITSEIEKELEIRGIDKNLAYEFIQQPKIMELYALSTNFLNGKSDEEKKDFLKAWHLRNDVFSSVHIQYPKKNYEHEYFVRLMENKRSDKIGKMVDKICGDEFFNTIDETILKYSGTGYNPFSSHSAMEKAFAESPSSKIDESFAKPNEQQAKIMTDKLTEYLQDYKNQSKTLTQELKSFSEGDLKTINKKEIGKMLIKQGQESEEDEEDNSSDSEQRDIDVERFEDFLKASEAELFEFLQTQKKLKKDAKNEQNLFNKELLQEFIFSKIQNAISSFEMREKTNQGVHSIEMASFDKKKSPLLGFLQGIYEVLSGDRGFGKNDNIFKNDTSKGPNLSINNLTNPSIERAGSAQKNQTADSQVSLASSLAQKIADAIFPKTDNPNTNELLSPLQITQRAEGMMEGFKKEMLQKYKPNEEAINKIHEEISTKTQIERYQSRGISSAGNEIT